MSWRSAGSTWPSSGRRSLEELLGGREARLATRRSAGRGRGTAPSGPARAPRGRSASGSARARPGRSCVTSGLVSLGELVEALERRARLALERRQRDEGLLQLAGRAPRSSRTRGWSCGSAPRSWSPRSVSAPNTTPVLRDQPLHRALLAVEDLDAASSVSSANGPRLPSASLMSAPVAVDRLAPASASRSGTPRASSGRTRGRSRRARPSGRPAPCASVPSSGDRRRRRACPGVSST